MTAQHFVRSRWDVLTVMAIGGALGSAARWGLGLALPHGPAELPWATLAANWSGGFCLGVLTILVIELWPKSRLVRPFFGVGILGGYTTFSTWMLESRNLIATGHVPLALAYAGLTLGVGLIAAWLGLFAGRALVTRVRGGTGGDQL